jgi:alkylation response protein AidB-like acyl-CoA dehydrogenase
VTNYAARARRIADDVLFPAAIAVDRAGAVPDSHFQALADAGCYGLAAPVELGGAGLDLLEFLEVVEILVGGCLATTFVWIQHHGVVMAVTKTKNTELRDRWLTDLISGRRRAAVAFAGAIPQPPRLWSKRVDGGYLLSGEAPFVSGWHSTDVVLVSARASDTDEVIVSGMIETRAPDGPVADQVHLVAAQGSDTVRLTFNDYFLPQAHVTTELPKADFLANQVFSLRANGTVALGIARRCVRLLAEGGHTDSATTLATQLAAVRTQLDEALTNPPTMPAARAAGAELAYRAAGAAVAAFGSAGITVSHHAQRLAREAMFAMVAGNRPQIKTELVRLLGDRSH